MVSLKKEIKSIVDSAKPVSENEYALKRVNEYGYTCEYHFTEDMRKELIKRAGRPTVKSRMIHHEIKRQKDLLFLKENRETIEYLYRIAETVTSCACTAQEASRILFKKGPLPPGFCRKGSYYYIKGGSLGECNIEHFINLLPILPKAWLKEIGV